MSAKSDLFSIFAGLDALWDLFGVRSIQFSHDKDTDEFLATPYSADDVEVTEPVNVPDLLNETAKQDLLNLASDAEPEYTAVSAIVTRNETGGTYNFLTPQREEPYTSPSKYTA